MKKRIFMYSPGVWAHRPLFKDFLCVGGGRHGLWDLNSLTRDWTHASCTGSTVLTTGPPKKSSDYFRITGLAYTGESCHLSTDQLYSHQRWATPTWSVDPPSAMGYHQYHQPGALDIMRTSNLMMRKHWRKSSFWNVLQGNCPGLFKNISIVED